MKKMLLILFLFCFSFLGISQNIVVSGAGSAEVNGTYVQNGTQNGKPRYQFGIYSIEWDGFSWVITDGFPFYYSSYNVATPDLITDWSTYFGEQPLPTVSYVQLPSVFGQPSNAVACVGTNAYFFVSASDVDTYQWQYSSGGTWNNIIGETNQNLFVNNVDLSINNYSYRCILSNSNGSTVTSSAVLSVITTNPTIVTQPTNLTVCSGTNAVFEVEASNAVNYQWNKVNPRFSGINGNNYDIVDNPGKKPVSVMVNSVPYICYVGNGNVLRVKKWGVDMWGANTWVNVGNLGSIGSNVDFPSIATNGTDIFVSYADVSNGSKATVIKFNGTVWSYVGTAGFSVAGVEYTGIAINASEPYVVFRDLNLQGRTTVMKFNGTSWVNVGSPGFLLNGTSHVIAFSGNTPYVALAEPDEGISIIKFNGTSWNYEYTRGMDIPSQQYSVSLFFEGTTAYFTGSRSSKVHTWDGTTKSNIGGFGYGDIGNYFYLSKKDVMFFNGTFYVSYGVNNQGGLGVSKWNGSYWELVGNNAYEGDYVNYTTLLNDGSDLFVSYYSVGNGSTALKKLFINETISGANSSVFTVNNININDDGNSYYCDVINSCGTTSSNVVSLNVNLSPSISSVTPASRCGTGILTLTAAPSAGTIKWYDAEVDGNEIVHDGSSIIISGNNLTISNLASTTTYYAEATNGSCVSAARTAVVGTVNSIPLVDEPVSRNANISYALPVLTNGSYFTESNGLGSNLMAGSPITNTQTIYVYNNDGTCWNEHSFTVTILTTLTSGYFGATFSHLNQNLNVRPVIGALNYRFEISDGESTVYFTKGSASTSFTLQEVGGLSYGKTYTIRVAYTTDGDNWTAYGKACSVTVSPLTRINTWYCNKTITNLNAFLSVATVSGASNYRYRISDGENTYYYERGSSNTEFRLSWVNGTAMNKTYTIQVQSTINGSNWSPYGASCVINTGSGFQKEGESMILEELKLTAYPNPNNGEFTISSSHEGTFNIINELGQLVRTVEITKENNYQVQIDSMHALNPLQPGVYFITGTINGDVITEKIIVQ